MLGVLGATGPKAELEEAAREVKCHALALTLLGGYLADACGGDVRKRKEIGPLEGDVTGGEHAKRLMDACVRRFRGGPEVTVLWLLDSLIARRTRAPPGAARGAGAPLRCRGAPRQ